jgi:hypothetical protein
MVFHSLSWFFLWLFLWFFYGELIPLHSIPGHSKLLEAPFSGTSQKTPREKHGAVWGMEWSWVMGFLMGFIGDL